MQKLAVIGALRDIEHHIDPWHLQLPGETWLKPLSYIQANCSLTVAALIGAARVGKRFPDTLSVLLKCALRNSPAGKFFKKSGFLPIR